MASSYDWYLRILYPELSFLLTLHNISVNAHFTRHFLENYFAEVKIKNFKTITSHF
jgi:hypothetical protein